MTGHAFQILLTDADALAVLETMRVHLNEHGRIAFETRNPRLDWAAEWAARAPRICMSPPGVRDWWSEMYLETGRGWFEPTRSREMIFIAEIARGNEGECA